MKDDMLTLNQNIPFLKVSDDHDAKRPFLWGSLPSYILEPHLRYYEFISILRDFIKKELDIKSVRLVT